MTRADRHGRPCDECNVGPNSEVHNTGEVWASMLWECYAALLDDTLGGTPRLTFAEAQGRMRDYLVASLKMTPNQPTFVEARDAVLAVAAANDLVDHALFCAAFAKRGLGQGAVAPDRFSSNNSGVVESFSCQNQLEIVDVALAIPAGCDADSYLDDGETGVLSVTIRNNGGGPLTATSAQVTTAHPLVTIANGGVIAFPTTVPWEEATGTVNISIAGAVGIEDFRLDVDVSDPSVSLPVPGTSLLVRANADEVLAASATDDVEASQTLWTSAGSGGPWTREQIETTPPLEFVWSGPDVTGVTDFALTSPPLQVANIGSFGFTFQHRHDFEAGFDGGVLELSDDGGMTWTDIGSFAMPGYTGTIDGSSGSPIALQPAYTGQSAGYPAFVTVTVDLGISYQGQTVQVRFRLATDQATGGGPWQIDDVAFPGIVGTPFAAVVPDAPCVVDADGDGYDSSVDCDDLDDMVNPGATEVPGDGVDQNCDGVELCFVDADGDGFRPNAGATVTSADLDCDDPGEAGAGDPVGDCNDAAPGVHPGAPEVCNDLVDNDCDNLADCADSTCVLHPSCPEPASLCTGGPFVCKSPGLTKLSIKNDAQNPRDLMTFTWTVGDATTPEELGDPSVDTRYTVCVWDDVAGTPTLVMEMEAPPASNCSGRPCWRPFAGGTGFRYRDPGLLPDGIQQVKIKSGALGKSRMLVRARGDMLPDPPMPFKQEPRITVQVVNSLGYCWGTHYVTAPLVNTGAALVAKERP
jgi:hypothetical protein